MVEQLFYNGDIITMENFDDAPEAVLVRDGNIIAVGTLKDLKALTTPECQIYLYKAMLLCFLLQNINEFDIVLNMIVVKYVVFKDSSTF